MKIVYATGSPHQLDFHLASSRVAVPPDAIMFAICNGERTIENQDEDLFAAITYIEYCAMRAMVREAKRLEAERHRVAAARPARKFYHWLCALFSEKNRQRPAANGALRLS